MSSTSNVIHQGFEEALASRGFTADAAQRDAIVALAGWYEAWSAGRRGWRRTPAAGVYLWGGVGRGKSFVLDAFFAAVPIEHKRRVHFHAFLQELQARMRPYAGQPDPLVLALKALAQEVRLLCIDEFHVHDIGDAMLLRRLLDVLVDEGVGLVATSNYPPEGLCPNPLYRERFVPAIRVIEKRFTVLSLDAGTDYRERPGYHWGAFIWPEARSPHAIPDQLGLLKEGTQARVIEVNHHPMRVLGEHEASVWLCFDDLCRQPHSTADYLWLMARFPKIGMSGVPPLADQPTDACQRFINFVDIAYDQGVELLLGSEVDLEALCTGSPHQDFARTRSRLRQLTPCRLEEASTT